MAGSRGWSAWIALSILQSGWAEYDYGDILDQYCHTSLDWGPIPERPEGVVELLQVQVFIRHGSRVQCKGGFCWEGDSAGNFSCSLDYLENSVEVEGEKLTPDFRLQYAAGRNVLPGNCLLGQLVEDGFEMERRNGQRLREAYVVAEELIPSSLLGMTDRDVDRTFRLRSTDVPRTKQSAMALVSALYRQQSLGAMPYLRLRTMDFDRENMVPNSNLCPSMKWRQAAFFDGVSQEFKGEAEGLCAQLYPQATLTFFDCFTWLVHLMDCLMSRMCPTVPFEPRGDVPSRFLENNASTMRRVWKAVDVLMWEMYNHLTEGGAWASLVTEVLEYAQLVASSASDAPKFLLFSGHDIGPMEVLYAALGLREEPPYWPPFASMLVMELWSTDSGPLVRWISNGRVVVPPTPWSEYRLRLEKLAQTAPACNAKAPPAALQEGSGGAWMSGGFASFALGCLATLAVLMVLRLLGFPQCSRSGREFFAETDSECLSEHPA